MKTTRKQRKRARQNAQWEREHQDPQVGWWLPKRAREAAEQHRKWLKSYPNSAADPEDQPYLDYLIGHWARFKRMGGVDPYGMGSFTQCCRVGHSEVIDLELGIVIYVPWAVSAEQHHRDVWSALKLVRKTAVDRAERAAATNPKVAE